MCAPAVVPIAMMAGSALGAYGKIQAGQAEAAAAEHNIAMGEFQAADALARAEDEKQLLAHSFLKEQASGRVEAAGGNIRIGTGSSLDWENDLIETYISDKAAIDEGAAREVFGIRGQQQLDRLAGRGAKRAAVIGAGASLLSGAGQAGSAFYTPGGAA